MRTNIIILTIAIFLSIGITTGMNFYQSQLKAQFTQIPCLHIEEKIKNIKTKYHAFNYCLSSKKFKFSLKDYSGYEYQYESPCISSGQRSHLVKYNPEDFFYGTTIDC